MAIQRGEIYFVNLNPVKGREQAGQRPVLVLSIDAINRAPLVVTVVVGTKRRQRPARLSIQRAGVHSRKRVADGNHLPLFPSSLARPGALSRTTCREVERSGAATGGGDRALLFGFVSSACNLCFVQYAVLL